MRGDYEKSANKFYINGHSVIIGNDKKLIIDGKVVDAKLKRSLFGGGLCSFCYSKGEYSKIKSGRNTIILDGDAIYVNGKEASFSEESISGGIYTDNNVIVNSHITCVVNDCDGDVYNGSTIININN